MKDRNPVDNIRFFSRYNDFESFHISRQKVSFVVPEQYEETAIQIFTRDADKVGVRPSLPPARPARTEKAQLFTVVWSARVAVAAR